MLFTIYVGCLLKRSPLFLFLSFGSLQFFGVILLKLLHSFFLSTYLRNSIIIGVVSSDLGSFHNFILLVLLPVLFLRFVLSFAFRCFFEFIFSSSFYVLGLDSSSSSPQHLFLVCDSFFFYILRTH